ncbi:unnamed protein product [Adineta steineri]|uniref:VLIG-type G domain-containing protein n=1 Tax=Adineta steineri TaxID=433720 RepID=A0A815H2T4_9BILA|nr:unnamed protein product [Adineta steineri]CAF3881492.1 unnamed protein product [Adineta steineri]
MDLNCLLQHANCIHSTPVDAKYFTNKDYELLKKWRSCLCSYGNIGSSTGLDQTFNTLVDEAINPQTLVEEIVQNHSLKVYVIDSLKRYNSLMDIIHILPSFTELKYTHDQQEHRTTIEIFFNITESITKSVLLTTTIESMSYESQRYFGNFIKKNDLPVPFAYYMWNNQINSVEYKINFNILSEIMCLTSGQYILQIGSESTIGKGKTSMLQYIFPDKRSEALNTDGNSTLRNGCIDVLFSPDKTGQNDESYVIFDTHGTMNIFNEDIITSIQTYCSLQILYVTEKDLNSIFLNSMMNYSNTIQVKPTIVIIFDANYDDKHYSPEKLIDAFKLQYKNWKYVKWTTAPPSHLWYQHDHNKKNKDSTRSQHLLKSFKELRDSTNAEVQKHIKCTSIFSIQSYYRTVKTSTNFGAPVECYFEIEDRLKQLFGDLNEKTENLRIATPVSYLNSVIKQCEKELLNNWDAPQTEIQSRKENLIRERSKIASINRHTVFFIDLLTKCSYTELLITEKYLEKWRSKYESTLLEELSKTKVEASKLSSRMKQIEERLSTEKNFNQVEKKQKQQELDNVKSDYDQQHRLANEINQKLMNIDLTIGLFCDEIMALYELSPHVFEPPNLIEDIAKTFVSLMLKGFAIHILRGRPLRCHNELIEKSIKYLPTTTQGSPLVLTVIGEQSSAKSSLMNTTFGCSFRVSAGRCTIGMYMSVIHWKSRTIVIFDTEGLLSLEEAGSIFDNQMITMAVLSSHLVLINHKGEVSSNLKDLIGMSFYAKLNIHSPIKPKLLFVLRDQADLSSKKTFFRQLTQLKDQLQNDSKFLKTSIDDELDINNENVYLLPNAFSHDTDVISNIPRCWRNQTFPQEIIKLRQIIFKNITSTTKPQSFHQSNRISSIEPQSPIIDAAYTDMTQLYIKISSNWEAIDRLGPQLLECKTLYELSIMKELQAIANGIIKTINSIVYQNGEKLIDETLLKLSRNNFIDMDHNSMVEQFNHQLSLIITGNIEQAQNNFNKETQRSCYPPEIKLKITKRMESPIRSAQHLLKEMFEERLLDLLRKTRIDEARKQLLDAVQKAFDQNQSLQLDDFKNRLQTNFHRTTEQYQRDLQSSFEAESAIIEKILRFYNNELRCKQGETSKENIYNLLPIMDKEKYKKDINRFRKCLTQFERQPRHQTRKRSNSVWQGVKSFFKGPTAKPTNALWEELKGNISWSTNYKIEEKNKNLFTEIWNVVFGKLEEDLLKLISQTKSFSSDPKTIQHFFQFIENAMNSPCITTAGGRLEKHELCSDLAVIGLDTIFIEAIAKEKSDYEVNLQNATNEMQECKDFLYKQCMAMKDAFELGRTLAGTIGKQIIEDISRLLQRRMEKNIKEDIVRSEFINHEAIQKQAYEESFNQADGENILKYIDDINRYFIELSLKEIKTKAVAVTHKHVLKLQHFIILAIDKANEVVQQGQYSNTSSVRDDVRIAILNLSKLKLGESADTEIFRMFSLNNVLHMQIKDSERFKKGFASIRDNYNGIEEGVDDLTKKMKAVAFESCKQSIAQKLGCQARCPGCGAKCSKPEPHDKEEVEVWENPCKKCSPNQCTCTHPETRSVKTHESTYHLAGAFHGWVSHPLLTPCLRLCYQHWTTRGVYVGKQRQPNNLQNAKSDETEDEDEIIFPKAKYYNERHPAWYNNLKKQSTEGNTCNELIPPPDQRRAWMVVRHAIINRRNGSMIDNKEYDDKLYPLNADTLPADFEPVWKDENFE